MYVNVDPQCVKVWRKTRETGRILTEPEAYLYLEHAFQRTFKFNRKQLSLSCSWVTGALEGTKRHTAWANMTSHITSQFALHPLHPQLTLKHTPTTTVSDDTDMQDFIILPFLSAQWRMEHGVMCTWIWPSQHWDLDNQCRAEACPFAPQIRSLWQQETWISGSGHLLGLL